VRSPIKKRRDKIRSAWKDYRDRFASEIFAGDFIPCPRPCETSRTRDGIVHRSEIALEQREIRSRGRLTEQKHFEKNGAAQEDENTIPSHLRLLNFKACTWSLRS